MADAPEYAHGQFCWHEVATRDVGAAKSFYQNLFGWSTEDMPMPGDMEGSYTMAKVAGGDVAGMYAMAGEQFEGVPSHWATHVWVDDVAGTAAKTEELGGTVVMGAMEIPGVGEMAVLQDPAGAVINIFKGSGHRGAAQHGMTPGAVGWNELSTPDGAAAKAFYSGLFGWTANTSPVPGSEGMEYTTFMQGEQAVGGMIEMKGEGWEGVQPNWMPYLTVEDCEGCATKAEGLGATVRVPAQTVPGVGTFSVIADPTGAAFSIMKWDMPSE